MSKNIYQVFKINIILKIQSGLARKEVSKSTLMVRTSNEGYKLNKEQELGTEIERAIFKDLQLIT